MASLANQLYPYLMGRPQRLPGSIQQAMIPEGVAPVADPFAMQQQAMPQGGGFLDDLLSPEVALPMAGAMLAGESNAEGFGAGLMYGGKAIGELGEKRKVEEKENRTLQYLRKSRPDIAQMVEAGMPIGDAWQLATSQPKATDDQREYEFAKQQGFQGTFMDYQVAMKEAGRNQVNIDTGEKLPSGFRWRDNTKRELGVEPIPGGPGEQIPGELAARVGMADSFLKQLPAIRENVKQGKVTGVVDRTSAAWGFGAGSETYRQIQSGTDVLQRLLTGAGMNMTEAEQYARRYLPTYFDDAASVKTKLDQLERELIATRDTAMRGRGGTPAGSGDGWQDMGDGVRIRPLP